MSNVQSRARAHEETVKAVGRGELPKPVKRTARPSGRRRIRDLDYEVTVHPLVMAEVRRLLAGSYTRVEVVDSDTVYVR